MTRFLCLLPLLLLSCKEPTLNHWSDGPLKDSLEMFITETAHTVPEAERFALFDMDGTLLCERPGYMEVVFSQWYMQKQLATDSALAASQPYKALLEQDSSWLENNVETVLTAPFEGMAIDHYEVLVDSFLRTAEHPRFKRPYGSLFYAPMVELVSLLQAEGFTVYISSNTQQNFIRAAVRTRLGIPDEQVIGSLIELEFDRTAPGFFTRGDSVLVPNELKAELIEYHIGEKPLFVAGNSRGDTTMLAYGNAQQPAFALLVNHDDSLREYYYPDSALLDQARQHRWFVADMKEDFKELF